MGDVELFNCDMDVDGLPARMLHEPVPGLAELAAMVAVPVTQMVWSGPALAVAAGAFTITSMLSVEFEHGLLLMVQRKV